MTKTLLPGATIGIIGAGQLGKMLAQAAQKMGYRIAMYDPNPDSCGFGVAHAHTVGDFNDRDALLAFAKDVDVLTYEFENINGELLKELEQVAYLPQGSKLLLVSQNRLREKTWLNEIGCPTAAFCEVSSPEDLQAALANFGYPAILKTNRFGYDGKGQYLLKAAEDIDGVPFTDDTDYILEAFVPFTYEASVMVSRSIDGRIEFFPITKNQHRQGILYSSLAGSEVSADVIAKMHDAAKRLAEAGELVGVCGVEFFIDEAGGVMVNEIAPRPHNSGHYSIEACNVSQYDQHILAIAGRSIVPVQLMERALMINILGQHMADLPEVFNHYPEAMVHIYDKGEAKAQRKMGHFTLLSQEPKHLEDILAESDFLKAWEAKYDQV